MLNPASLPGLRPAPVPADTKQPDVDAPQPSRLVPGSAPAKALFSVWSGNPVTVLSAPPGSGKSTAIVDIVSELAQRTDLRIAVACPTRAQVFSLAQRLSQALPTGAVFLDLNGVEADALDVDSLSPSPKPWGREKIRLSTLAKFAFRSPGVDVMVVDEAAQATFAQVASAANDTPQLLLVGDPGQIGPVVTSGTDVFTGSKTAPHLRALDVFATFDGAVCENLDATFRLGPQTTRALTPLYPFAFASKRPPRRLVLDATLAEVVSIDVGTPQTCDDDTLMAAVVDRVHELLSGSLDLGEGLRAVVPSDIAVVVSRNSQVAHITGLLRRDGLRRLEVGTADRLQGGEWPLVVSLDPLCGDADRVDHAVSPGRLCVMASRHQVHLSWLYPSNWRDLLTGTADEQVAVCVRDILTEPTHA